MNRAERRAHSAQMKERPKALAPVPRSEWLASQYDPKRFAVWLSRSFLVQIFTEDSGVRLSVNRVSIAGNGRWKDEISWEELQEIKRTVGYGDQYAIEVYPPEKDIVNVANMRHLWVLNTPLDIGWKSEK